MDEAARIWKLKILEMNRLLNLLPPRNVIKVKYEKLCTEPQKILDRIVDFAQLPEHRQMDTAIDLSKRHILGNSMRLKAIDAVKMDEKWKRELSSGELELFNSVCGPINLACGYQ